MLLVDAYNVLMVEGVLPPHLAGLDLTGLAALLAISRYSRRQAVLVCDGRDKSPRGQVGARTAIRYSGPDRTADDVILGILASHSAPRTVILVTSDRALAADARRRRAQTIRSEEFLAELARDEAAGGRTSRGRPMPALPLDRGLVERWMREFGYEPSTGAVSNRPKNPHRATRPAAPSAAAPNPGPGDVDPVLLAALEEWAGRLRLSDLDMERWLKGGVQNKNGYLKDSP